MTELKKLGRPPNEALREQRCKEILSAGAVLFAERGFGADTQELADRVGVAKGTLYRYFPSKEELFLASVDHLMDQLGAAVGEAAAKHVEPFEQIAAALEAYLGFFESHPQAVELLILERAHFKDRATPTYFVHREKNIGPWRQLLAALVADDRVRAMPVERILSVMSDLVYGAMFTNYFTGRKPSPKSQASDILDIVFRGILSDSERQARAADGEGQIT